VIPNFIFSFLRLQGTTMPPVNGIEYITLPPGQMGL
jgi:hypothetical protein